MAEEVVCSGSRLKVEISSSVVLERSATEVASEMSAFVADRKISAFRALSLGLAAEPPFCAVPTTRNRNLPIWPVRHRRLQERVHGRSEGCQVTRED